MPDVRWLDEPEDHDYPAARDYLELLLPPDLAESVTHALRQAPAWTAKAKDIARASGLALLGPDDVHVRHDLHKVEHDVSLSPVLLVRGSLVHGWPLVVADGYHRVCAVHHLEPNTPIPCRIVDLPA